MINKSPIIKFTSSLRTLLFIFVAGLVTFSLLCFYAVSKGGAFLESTDSFTKQFLFYESLIFILIFIPIGYFISNRKLKKIPKELSDQEKFLHYRGTFLVKISCITGTTLFSIVVYLLTGYLFIFIQIIIQIMFLIINAPKIERISKDLNISLDNGLIS